MTTYREHFCPWCDYKMDSLTSVKEMIQSPDARQPEDGDITLCAMCGQFAVFDSRSRGGLRFPKLAERSEMAENMQASALRIAWKRMVAEAREAGKPLDSRPIIHRPEWTD